MKHFRILSAVIVLALATACSSTYDRELLGWPEPQSAVPLETAAADTSNLDEGAYDTPPDSLAMFDDLNSYGSWYQLDPFGMVWRPIVVASWQPLQNGYWVWTTYGWMWVTNDPWGWATYHYGYWVNDFTLGWVWIPGYTWSPCQADWFTMGDYIGWAPMPPPGHPWRDPWSGGQDWTIVKAGKFRNEHVAQYHVPPTKFKEAYKERLVTRSEPGSEYIQKTTHESLKPVDVNLVKVRYGNRDITRVVFPGSGPGGGSPPPMRSEPPINSPPVSGIGGGGGGGGNSGNSSPPPTTAPAKRKSSPSPPPSNNNPPPRKYKAKDPGDSNSGSDSGGKTKGGSQPSKGSSSSPSKAKGKKG